MGQPAARITDMHLCPMVTGLVPHVGGPIIMGSPNVITGGMPQARVTDTCVCVGPPDMIVKGSATVLVNNLPAARMFDTTVHGGIIITGQPTVLIGDAGAGGGESFFGMFIKWVSDGLESIGFKPTPPAEWKPDVKGKFEFGKDLIERAMKGFGFMKDDPSKPPGWKEKVGFEIGIGAKKENEWRKFGDDDTSARIGTFDYGGTLGVKGNLNGDMHAGLFGNAKVAAVTGEAKFGKSDDIIRGKVEGEALSASAEAGLGFKKTDSFKGLEANIGAEANLVKASGEGSINISPKTVYDNTAGKAVRWVTGDETRGHLSDAWDHGIKAGGQVEAGVGAAAQAGARAGVIDGAAGVQFGAKLGAGPMAGFKAFLGIY